MGEKQREMSNLEYKFLCEELQTLVGARLVKIFELGENEFRFRFHISEKDVDIVCVLPVRLHATNFLKEAPREPTQFCMFLRKYLDGRKTEKITQYDLDRVLVFDFGSVRLIIELFSHGNLVLVGEEGIILNCYRKEEWKDRRLKPKEKYCFPASTRISPFEITPAHLETNNQKKLIAFLTSTINLASLYSEEACFSSGVPLEKKACGLGREEREKLAKAFETFSKQAPTLYVKDGQPIDYSLVPLTKYEREGVQKKQFASLSELLDEFYSKQKEGETGVGNESNKQREKLERKLADQQKHLQEMLAEAEETKKFGDAIYENYEKIEKILKIVQQGRKQNRKWEAIEKELEGLAKVNKDTGKIVVEV